MGFFSDLKEDLSQAVNELMPEDTEAQEEGFGDISEMLDRVDSIVIPDVEQEETQSPESQEWSVEPVEPVADAEEEITEELPEAEPEEITEEFSEAELEEITEELPETEPEEITEELPEAEFEENQEVSAQESLETELAAALEETAGADEPEPDMDLEKMLESALAANDMNTAPIFEEETETVNENQKETKGESKVAEMINARMASDETSSVTAGMTINGDVISEGSMDLIGCINGNIEILGKLNVTGYINGNSKAAEIYADNAKINGEVVSEGAVKIGSSSVVIGNICATSAVIAGAVKGDIDVHGPVILDTSAIVMGNIKSKSVQINNGAVIEGMCSQCYADVNPVSFFDDYKPEVKKGKKQ